MNFYRSEEEVFYLKEDQITNRTGFILHFHPVDHKKNNPIESTRGDTPVIVVYLPNHFDSLSLDQFIDEILGLDQYALLKD